jgi:hypothetical protein
MAALIPDQQNMKTTTISFWLISSALAATLLAGCEKKEAAVPATAPQATAPANQPVQPAANPVAATAVAPDARLAESQAALKAKDYDRAAATLLKVQRAQMNEQQAAAAAAQMRQLQSSLASAAASGDPRAIAAANRLRQASMVR